MESFSSSTTKTSGDSANLSVAELYKTELCEAFMNPNKKCKYGPRCRYAHGNEQLRTPEQNKERGIHTEEDIQNWLARGRQLAAMRTEKQHSRTGQPKKKQDKYPKEQGATCPPICVQERPFPMNENPPNQFVYVQFVPLMVPMPYTVPDDFFKTNLCS